VNAPLLIFRTRAAKTEFCVEDGRLYFRPYNEKLANPIGDGVWLIPTEPVLKGDLNDPVVFKAAMNHCLEQIANHVDERIEANRAVRMRFGCIRACILQDTSAMWFRESETLKLTKEIEKLTKKLETASTKLSVALEKERLDRPSMQRGPIG